MALPHRAPGAGTILSESYEVTKPDWAITNWFNGLMLRVDDRDDDLAEGMATTLSRIKAAAEASTRDKKPRTDQRHAQDA